MPLNKTKLPHTDMTPAQFQDWPHPKAEDKPLTALFSCFSMVLKV